MQGKVFSIPGVHGFGIGARGFVVHLEPKYFANEAFIPKELEGVPTEVELAEPFEPLSHDLTKFRPVPSGVAVGGSFADGTAGPHIVRITSEVRIHTLTAGHVLKLLDAPVSSIPVYQPGLDSPSHQQWGTLIHGFQHVPCDTPADPLCQSSSAPVNNTWEKPDVAAIQNISPADPYPHTSPAGSDEPIRRLQYGLTSYVNGPSGIIITPAFGTSAKMWGAYTLGGHAPAGSIAELITSVVSFPSQAGGTRFFKFQFLCIVNLERGAEQGDSGALVSGNGTGNRHVFGVVFARDQAIHTRVSFTIATDIQTAFNNSGFSFDHYWGTASGRSDLWFPAATQCDGSC